MLGIQSNSKGNLIKFTKEDLNKTYYLKTGRAHVRGFDGKWGIEPIIEVIASKLAELLQCNIVSQRLDVETIERYDKQLNTLVCVSEDFIGEKDIIYLQDLYSAGEISDVKFTTVLKMLREPDHLIKMLTLDLLLMNEDRHNQNVAFFIKDSVLELTPIYDNGYSLLYDDLRGMLVDYVRYAKYCACNAPIYEESFHNMERLFCKYGDIGILRKITDLQIESIILSVEEEYTNIISKNQLNNYSIPREWWRKVEDFIKWRINYLIVLKEDRDGEI